MRRRIFGLALVFSVFLLCVVSISHSDAASLKSSIVGKWLVVDWYGENLEFLKDGTFIRGDNVSDYRMIDDNRVRVTGPMGTGMLFEGSINNVSNTWQLGLKENNKVTHYYISEKDKYLRDTFADYHAMKGVEGLRERPFNSAIKMLNKSIELAPDLFKGYVGLASASSLTGDEDNACYWLSEAAIRAKNLDKLKEFILTRLSFSDKFQDSGCFAKILGPNFP